MAKIKIKLGELNATLLCHYTALADVARQVFGKEEEKGPGKLVKGEYNDLAQAPSFEMALAQINQALSFG